MPKHLLTNNNHPTPNIPIQQNPIIKRARTMTHNRTFVPVAQPIPQAHAFVPTAQPVQHTRAFVPAAQPVSHTRAFVPAAQPVIHTRAFVPAAPITPLHALVTSRAPQLTASVLPVTPVQQVNVAVPQKHFHQLRK